LIQFNRSNAGTMILLGLLIAAMLLTAALTFEAVTAERAHRAGVRRANRDDRLLATTRVTLGVPRLSA
jgi:hypothetical protein